MELFWTRTGLLLLLMLLTSAAALSLSGRFEQEPLRTLVTAIGTGALVSALVTTAQTLLTATASRRVLVDSLVEESRQAMRELTDEYRSMNSEFFPTHVFEPTADPDPAFNRLMMADLHNTRQYLFRGFSGRHAAARTLLASSLERELRVVIADPRDRNSINSRARYLLRQTAVEGSYAEIQARLYEDVCIGLVGLYAARGRCTRIDVTVTSNPPADRFELFDDSVWVALFSDLNGTATPYPRTLRFQRSSFIYNMQRSEFLRICNSRTALHECIYPDTDRDEFIAVFEKITGRRLSVRRFEALEEAFRAFRCDFAHRAHLGG
ncbi:MAG TPA: hypothetical protein VFR35_11665 [Actinoplanes sp.]|nr:hypothetical protein [Actinoplanes sp.]